MTILTIATLCNCEILVCNKCPPKYEVRRYTDVQILQENSHGSHGKRTGGKLQEKIRKQTYIILEVGI